MADLPDDAELLRRYAREGADDAFAELVRRYLTLVYHAALRQMDGDAHDAQEVTQRVFILLVRKATALSDHRTIAGWLYTTTRFTAAELRRAERRRRAREQEAYTMHNAANPNLGETAWEKLCPIIDETLAELNERDREVVLLRFFVNLPFGQIGARLNISENTARMRVERALEKLHALIARRGIRSTATALGLVLTNQSAAAVPAGLAGSVTSTALAAGTVPAGAMAGLMGFMSTTKLVMGTAAAVLLAAAIGSAFHEIESHRRATHALSVASAGMERLAARRRELGAEVRAAEQAAAELRTKVEEARAARAASPAGGEETRTDVAATAWDPIEQGTLFMNRHPTVRRALEDYAKARARFRYSTLYDSLGLTPDKIDEFQALMGRGIGMGAAGPEGAYPNRPLSLVAGPLIFGDEYSGRLRALLGDEGMQKLSEFQRSEPARELAVKVAGELWSTETPLTPQQSDELTRILANHRSKKAAMAGSAIAGYDWNAILTEAHGVLAPSQLAVLSGMQAREQFTQAINRRPAPATSGTKVPSPK